MKRPPKTKQTSTASHFFAKELEGEQPLSLETAGALCDLAGRFFSCRLWSRLAEHHLVLVPDPVSEEIHACSVMGALGEVFALSAYLGSEGYRFFQKVHTGRELSAGEFFAEQRSVYVHYVPRRSLTKPDRELLGAVGHATNKGGLAPQFRTNRPGYHPWYVTESEARILGDCFRAMIWISEQLSKTPSTWYWKTDGVYPFVSAGNVGEDGQPQYSMRMIEAPRVAPVEPVMPSLDQPRMERILERRKSRQGILQVDHFYGPGMIGKQNERKACFRVALAIDAETGFAYPPEAALPDTATGQMLANVLVQAMELGGFVPRQVHVRDPGCGLLLQPLAEALGFKVAVRRSLPALDFAKNHLLQMMGDPGPIAIVS